MRDDTCRMSYEHNGDIRACWLPLNHPDTCTNANHAAFLASLTTRTHTAQNEGWL